MVALRKESVDRNENRFLFFCFHATSLSARRAWIEIVMPSYFGSRDYIVALRKESVDRNSVRES